MNEPVLIALALAGGLLLVLLIWFAATYNRFVRLGQHIKESWAGIEVELKRRHDLIPNLVETVKGYAAHERETLASVTELRNRAASPHASAAALAADESALQRAVGRLFALAEAYPQLRADAHFLSLQKELANTEDRLAAARRFYNGNVRELNALCTAIPTNLIAGLFGFTPREYFELDSAAERVAPAVRVG